MEIVLASHNLHKIREFRAMLKAFKGVEILTLHQFPDLQLPQESGKTFLENALIKAQYVAQETQKWALGDDSGLVVPALNAAPGVFSARYAGEEATDADNRKKLLQEMLFLDGMKRAAYFECCLALCAPDGREKTFVGLCEGMILSEERGRNGFGYDSLFVKHDYDKSFAELDEATKNRISHRYKAFEKLALALETLGLKRERVSG